MVFIDEYKFENIVAHYRLGSYLIFNFVVVDANKATAGAIIYGTSSVGRLNGFFSAETLRSSQPVITSIAITKVRKSLTSFMMWFGLN